MKKICLLLLILLSLLTACSKDGSLPIKDLDKSNSINSDTLSDFYELHSSKISTNEIAAFATNNISNLSNEDASDLITKLITSQTYDKSIKSGMIYDYANFLDVYGLKFNYVWDVDKIKSVEDEHLRSFLLDLSKSYYKINTHKNYLDVDIDYDRLSKFNNLLPEVHRYIDINRSKRDILLNASMKGEIDYKILRDTIIDLEIFLKDYPNTKLLFESETLYKSLINMYFIGSDGLDPYDYDNKKFKASFFDTLIETSANYKDSMLAEISSKFLNQLDNKNEYKSIDFVSLISNYHKMGLKSNKSIVAVVSEKSNNSNIIYPRFTSFEDKNIENKINDKVKDEIESIRDNLNWSSDTNTKYNISYFVNYGSYKYISLQLTGNSYDRIGKENETIQKNLTFDLKTGNTLLLSDILNLNFDKYNDDFTNLIKSNSDMKSYDLSKFIKLEKEPDFMISSSSLVLYFEKGEYGFDNNYPVYVYIDHSNLGKFINFRELYN